MKNRKRTEKVNAKKRKARSEILYWFVGPVTDDERAIVRSFFVLNKIPAEVAYTPAKVPCFRVRRSQIKEDQLIREFRGMCVSGTDRFGYMHKQWTYLQTNSDA